MLNEYIDIFRRRRHVVMQAFALAFGVGVIITLFTAPTYRAVAYLLVEAPSNKINQVDASNPLSEIFSANQTYKIETQVRLLQSKDLLESTAKKLNAVLPRLTVKSLRDTDIIEVAAEGTNPVLASDAANTLLQTYIDEVADVNGQQVKQALSFTEAGAAKAQSDLEETERRLSDFKQRHKVAELDKNRDAQITVVGTLLANYDDLQAKLAAMRSQIAVTKKQMADEPLTETAAVSDAADPTLQGMENQIVGLEAERSGLLKRYTPINQKVAALDAQIAVLRAHLAGQRASFAARNERKNPTYAALRDRLLQYEMQISGLAAEAASTASRLVAARQRLDSFPSWEVELSRLQRQLEIGKMNYALLSAKREDLRLRDQTRHVTARIMEKATPPNAPVRPNHLQNILLGAFLGLAIGTLLALLQEYLDDRINSVEEAERVLQLPSLGLIPLVDEVGLRQLRSASAFSPIAEAYRGLRTNINFASVDNPVRTLMLTSTSPSEGKSMSVTNLAAVMAMDGRRVIVVDSDLRRPTIHKLFKLRQSPGLTDVLVGSHSISQALQATDIPNVKVITSGTQAPNPAELLGSEAMAHFVDAIREAADIVLFDSPPTLAVSDAILLSARMDGVLFVVSPGETKRGNARQALSLLARARPNVLGTVLNKLDTAGRGYYGQYYTSYAPISQLEDQSDAEPSETPVASVNGQTPQRSGASRNALPLDARDNGIWEDKS